MKVTDFGIARAGDAATAHQDRRGAGHRHLLLTGAGAGPRGRRPLRRLLARCRALRDAHRRRAVHRGEPGVGRVQARARGPGRAVDVGAEIPGRSIASCSPRWRRTSPRRTSRATTCAPTSCASSAVGRSSVAAMTAVAAEVPTTAAAAPMVRAPAAPTSAPAADPPRPGRTRTGAARRGGARVRAAPRAHRGAARAARTSAAAGGRPPSTCPTWWASPTARPRPPSPRPGLQGVRVDVDDPVEHVPPTR